MFGLNLEIMNKFISSLNFLKYKALYESKRFASNSLTYKLPKYQLHKIESPPNTIEINKEECLDMIKKMYTIRRMEMTCDSEYKQKHIRGYCHLYDGQEAVAVGIEKALPAPNDLMTSYRCHAQHYLRSGANYEAIVSVLGELLGRSCGFCKGFGGSMHLVNKEQHFWGGIGIVGSQVPIGAGLALADKYLENGNVAITMCGDGAANQGQVYETMNLANLYKLPLIIGIENNQFSMGSSIHYTSSNNKYYTIGNYIPGIKVDGMNVFHVINAVKYAKEYVANNGPIILEFNTYRYHGHSMSDPGTTYRSKAEIQHVRKTNDCINNLKHIMIENKLASENEILEIENRAKTDVQNALKEVLECKQPDDSYYKKFIYSDCDTNNIKTCSIRDIE